MSQTSNGNAAHSAPEGGGRLVVQAVLLWILVAAGLLYGVYKTAVAASALF